MLRGLRFEELARDPLRLAVPPNHAFARLRSVTLARVAREPLAAFGRKDYPEYHEYLSALFAAVKIKPRENRAGQGSPSREPLARQTVCHTVPDVEE